LQVNYLPLAELAPAERNARTHSQEQIAQLVASISAFGWTNPILIDEDRAIIAGHGRLEAAKAAGLADVPTITLAGLSAAQKRAFEYTRLLNGLQPRAFVAENVSGLIKGTAKGYFLEILRALRACGYRVEAKLLDAQWLGVPQSRQRLIFVGTRLDLDARPAFPTPLAYRYSVRDALPWVSGLKWDPHGQFNTKVFDVARDACSAVTVHSAYQFEITDTERRKFTIAELKRICGFPDDYILTGSYADQWARCGNAVPPVMMSHIANAMVPALTERRLVDAA